MESTSSTIGEDLKMDPQYSWVLKELNFDNDKRVIDVTKLLDQEEEEEEDNEKKQIKSNIGETLLDVVSSYEKTEMDNDDGEGEEEEEDEHLLRVQLTNVLNKNDNYQSVDTNVDLDSTSSMDENPDDARLRESVQKMQSSYLNMIKNQIETSSDEANDVKLNEKHRKAPRTRKFSRSFEVSLSDLDDRIGRLDNEIRLKRNNHTQAKLEPHKQQETKDKSSSSSSLFTTITKTPQNEAQNVSNQNVIETLKNEWSHVFNKLEEDYKKKLDEQQRTNEQKLKLLYDEIKQSIIMQQQQQKHQQIPNGNQVATHEVVTHDTNSDNELEQYTISSSSIQFNHSHTLTRNNQSESQSCPHNVESLVKKIDNAQIERKDYIESIKEGRSSAVIPHDSKYISNLRLTLKTKHARHIQDLKTYYEQEVEELRHELSKAQNKVDSSTKLFLTPKKSDKLTNGHLQESEDLKNQNLVLLQKIYESEQHVEYLRHENYEIKTQLNALNTELYLKDEARNKLETMYNQLEAQLNESLKIQNQQVTDLQSEKRTLYKRNQEIDELRRNLRASDDQIIELELKLSDRESENNELRARVSKLEGELSRIDKEFNKLRYRYSSGNPSILAQTSDSCETRLNKQQSSSFACINSAPFTQNDNSSSILKDNSRISLAKSPVSSYSNFLSSSSYKDIVDDFMHGISDTANSPRQLGLPFDEKSSNLAKEFKESTTQQFLSQKHLDYINHLETQFDRLMKRKQQLEAEITRLPYKATNTNMHVIKTSLENEISSVDKQLASIKLEMRKMNIIKSNH